LISIFFKKKNILVISNSISWHRLLCHSIVRSEDEAAFI